MFQKTCSSKFTTDKGSMIDVDVEIRWMPRLQRYRLEIMVQDPAQEIYSEDIPAKHRGTSNVETLGAVYSDLYDNRSDGGLEYFIEKLKALGIEVTSDFVTDCRALKEEP